MVAEVLAYSIRKHASKPVRIQFIRKDELDFKRAEDPLAATEFTYTRFLVPYLNGYQGKALFMDNDMICLSDIWEILDLPMDGYALRVRKQDHIPADNVKMDGRFQSSYPRKNWSSLMLMDCSKLTCWSKEAVETQSAKWLHRFEPIPDELIGDLPAGWNDLDKLTSETKLCHMSTGGPWNCEKYADAPGSIIWYKYYFNVLNNRP